VRCHAKATSAIAAICGIVLCLCASPAMAAKGVVGFIGGPEGTQGGQFSSGPNGAAVNQNGNGGASAGDVYIVDGLNNRVQQFSSSGAFVRTFGLDVGGAGVNVCTVAASCVAGTESDAAGAMSNPQGIAIEASTGNLYVTDQGNRRVDVFSATGAFQGAFGWNVDKTAPAEELQLCTAATECQAGSAGAGAGQLGFSVGYPAISPLNGHLLVPSKSNRRIDEFSPTITAGLITGVSFVRGYGGGAATGAKAFEICTTVCHEPAEASGGLGRFGGSSPTALAIDSTGRVYALDPGNHPTSLDNKRVQAFSSTATPEGAFADDILSAQTGFPIDVAPVALTVDLANDHVLAAKGCTEFLCPDALKISTEQRILELSSAGGLLETYEANAGIGGIDPGQSARGIASVSGGGDIYVTVPKGPDNRPGAFIIGSGPQSPPSASIDPVSAITAHTATFSGHVNPQGWQTDVSFEYSADGAKWKSISAGSIVGDNSEHAVSAEVEELGGSSHYQVRLVATKRFNAGTATAETSFDTPASPPTISSTSAVRIADTSARLEGKVNPEGELTTYRFEYVSDAKFQATGYAEATSVPLGGEGIGDGIEGIVVSQSISGLSPATTYHFRLIATNPTDTVESADGIFTTFLTPPGLGSCPNDAFRTGERSPASHPGASLPDCRAYEQASATNKNGIHVTGNVYSAKASVNGDAVSFESIAGLPGADGAGNFPTFLAKRGATDWSTQGLLPPASLGHTSLLYGWTTDFSYVFNQGRVFSEDKENGFPAISVTLVARSTIDRSVTTIAPYAAATGEPAHAYVGASADGSAVFFESRSKFTPNAATGAFNLYAWDRASGALRLAGALNGSGEGTAPEAGSFGGSYNWINEELTRGGAARQYYTQDQHVNSVDGSRVYFTAGETGQVYLRKNPTKAQSPLDGEGKCTAPPLACTVHVSASQRAAPDPNGPLPAQFMAATPDGSSVFFTSHEELTDDANTGPAAEGKDLYRYDADTGELTDLTPDSVDANGAGVRGVLGTSDDGSYVYFAANGVLSNTPNSRGESALPGDCSELPSSGGTGSCSLYVAQGDDVRFISGLKVSGALSDSENWKSGFYSGNEQQSSRVSADGRVLLFRSQLQLTSYDNDGVAEFYRYDANDPELLCVSCNPSGALPTKGPMLGRINPPVSLAVKPARVLSRNLSFDGNRFFFETPEKLVASDVNGDEGCPLFGGYNQGFPACIDVYEWEAKGSRSCHSDTENGGCLYLISLGKRPEPSLFADASASGDDVFFFTTDRLVGQDGDELFDVYDASVDGGLASQNPAPTVPCEGEACKGGASAPPVGQTAGTPNFVGPVNPKAIHKKAKKRRHRAKKRHKKRAAKHARNHR
jgi:hypothetical protein